MKMRYLCLIIFFVICNASRAQTIYQKDFAYFWQIVNDNFAYFDKQKTDWNKVRKIYQPQADTITSTVVFVGFLERVINELYNGHVSLNTNTVSSNRLIPTGADIWIFDDKKDYRIRAVRKGFNADRAGLKAGMIVTHFNGVPVIKALKKFLPVSVESHDWWMYDYALNMLFAGTHDTKRSITVLDGGSPRTYYPDSIPASHKVPYTTLVESKILPGNFGYIRINNSLGNYQLISDFDKTLDSLFDTKGLVLDLTETPSGGNTTVARAIMGRFIEREMPYQKHNLPNEEKKYGIKRTWIELVSPRGKMYKKPVVVLVNHWTGSMGEGMAMGFDAMNRATVIGTRMAGLLGAIYSYTMPETKIGFSIPVEKLFHVNGLPREDFDPEIGIRNHNEFIETALKLLKKKK